jgi:hypothetical protein
MEDTEEPSDLFQRIDDETSKDKQDQESVSVRNKFSLVQYENPVLAKRSPMRQRGKEKRNLRKRNGGWWWGSTKATDRSGFHNYG